MAKWTTRYMYAMHNQFAARARNIHGVMTKESRWFEWENVQENVKMSDVNSGEKPWQSLKLENPSRWLMMIRYRIFFAGNAQEKTSEASAVG